MAASSADRDLSSIKCSDVDGANEQATVRHTFVHLPDESESLSAYQGVDKQPVAVALVSKNGEEVYSSDEIDGDPSGYPRPVSRSSEDSIDKLVAEYSEMEISSDSDGEKTDHDKKDHRRNTIKIARQFSKVKEDHKKLEARFESHWKFAETLQNENAALKNEKEQLEQELEQLKSSNVPDSETKNSERIRSLEMELKEKNVSIKKKDASMQMLTYGVQSKCGVCKRATRIINSHPYSQVVLETVFGGDFSGIYDLQQDKKMKPSTCKWNHLCHKCDNATSQDEKSFNDYFESLLQVDSSKTSEKISISHADLLHVYTFRALLRNVDIHHYIPGCEDNPQRCTCSDVLHSLNGFLKRAHHLGQLFVWKDRPANQEITPSEAGMLFHVCKTEVPPEHWIEFPLICKVHFESEQRSHHIIFAQIPPLYWAFPLPHHTKQDVPDSISDEIRTSDVLVTAHYKEAMDIADQLSKYFEQIIAKVNEELELRRVSLLQDGNLKKWLNDLKGSKQEMADKEAKLQDEEQKCIETEEDLLKKIEEIKEKQEKNMQSMKEIKEQIENCKKDEKTIGTARGKRTIMNKLDDLVIKRREIIADDQKLNKDITKYTDDSEDNASKQEQLCRTKLDLIKEGLCADFEPKLIIGYFRTKSHCCLEVKIV